MLAAALLVLGIALGALITMATYATELRRIARFLQTREPRSNARATTAVGAPGIRDLADAVNTELDRSSRERVDAQRHQDEFQRDLSALSHDIRTPLTGAKGYLQLAYDETDARTRQLHLAAATSRIDSTTALLDELFAYTKSTDPDLTINMQTVALRPLIERVLVGHYPEFEKRGWEPELCMPDEAPERGLVVLADPDALARILENLVTNAVRHGSDAPRVLVQLTDRKETAVTVENPVASTANIDTARLFDRFYQADSARHAAGSGLGLAVSANLAHAMGMELTAHLSDAAARSLSITLTCPR